MQRLNDTVLFITPPSAFTAYTGTKINAVTQHYPLLQYMHLSSYIKQFGFKTKVLDLGIEKNPWSLLPKILEKLRPRIIAMTCTTPLFYEVKLIGMIVKAILGEESLIVTGGIHVSALPEESLTETMSDIVVIGEGEITFKEICEGRPLEEISGIAYRKDKNRRMIRDADSILNDMIGNKPKHLITGIEDGETGHEIRRTPRRQFMTNDELDALPFADLDLYDIYRYKNPHIIARKHPLILMETSRGCPFHCNFCSSENVYREMSPERIIEEMKEFKKRGIKEIKIVDDQFAVSIKRAKKIFELILQENLKFHINLANGIRVDRLDLELLQLAKKAGVYQLGIGFESSDQTVLDSMQKGLKDPINTGLRTMEIIRKSGLESVGFFIFGAPEDTEESLNRTIAFAKMLRPDYAKVTIMIPFPDTRLFAEYEKKGLIKSRQWDLYNIHQAVDIYKHPNGLTPELLRRYYHLFYKEYYLLNPRYILMRIWKGIKNGNIFSDIWGGLKTFFPNFIPGNPRSSFRLHPIFIWYDLKHKMSNKYLVNQLSWRDVKKT